MLAAIWTVLLDLAPWLLIGTAASSLLHRFLPPGWLSRQLRGAPGVAKAVVLGVPLPLCSCGVIPAGIGLKKEGATDGAAIGFLISTPQTGVDSVLVAASFLGWPFALFKVFAAFLTGLLGGLATEWTTVAAPAPAPPTSHTEAARTWAQAWEHGVELLQSIWGWLAVGILVSATLSWALPEGALAESVLGSGPLAILAVLALSVPLYVCATASVPIAAGLVAAGLPTGAALVFLMAGPATNVATIGAVHHTFGRRVLGIYLAVVVGGSVVLGLLFDAWFGATAVQAVHHHQASWAATASAVLLVGVMAWFAYEDAAHWVRSNLVKAPADARHEVDVQGMTCGGCAKRLDKVLRSVDGVTAVQVDHEAGQATVFGSVSDADVRAAIVGAGFEPV